MKKNTNKRVISIVNRVYDGILSWAISKHLARKELSAIKKRLKIDLMPTTGEREWKVQWKNLSKNVNYDYYRVYSRYIGHDMDIVPDDICHNVIEQILNPQKFKGCIDDKNLFDLVMSTRFSEPITPCTILRSLDGELLNSDYKVVNDFDSEIKRIAIDKLIAKPTFDSSSGVGVCMFNRIGGVGDYIDVKTGVSLSKDYLERTLGENYIVQECLQQSDFMSQFCKTAVNTIRVATYRSVRTGKVDVINSIMRIGLDGSFIDNAHGGGCFVGVGHDGKIGKYLCNQYGERFERFNGIDFSKSDFVIPNIEKVWDFSCKVASAVPHMKLIQLDIAIDKEGNPKLIEYNIRAFSPWLYQFTTGPAFGKYTQEIIDYCIEHKDKATRITISF